MHAQSVTEEKRNTTFTSKYDVERSNRARDVLM
jgi:hypothetical protein